MIKIKKTPITFEHLTKHSLDEIENAGGQAVIREQTDEFWQVIYQGKPICYTGACRSTWLTNERFVWFALTKFWPTSSEGFKVLRKYKKANWPWFSFSYVFTFVQMSSKVEKRFAKFFGMQPVELYAYNGEKVYQKFEVQN